MFRVAFWAFQCVYKVACISLLAFLLASGYLVGSMMRIPVRVQGLEFRVQLRAQDLGGGLGFVLVQGFGFELN